MDTGSPIEVRLASSGFVYSFVAFFVVVAIILAVLYFLYLKYRNVGGDFNGPQIKL